MMRFLKRLICRFRGHKCECAIYVLGGDYTSKALYFCERCGTELFGRTFEDLEPMTDEEREAFDRHDEMEDFWDE